MRIEATGGLRWYALLCYAMYVACIGLYLASDLAVRPIWTDEAFTYFQVADRSFAAFVDSFNAGVNVTPYLSLAILWVIDQLVGLGPLGLRLPSAICAIAAIVLLHRLLARYFGHAIALICCIAGLMLSKEFVLYSHEARPYSMFMLMAVVSLAAGLSVLRSPPGDGRSLLMNAVAAFLLPATHYVGLFYGSAIALSLLFAARSAGVGTLVRIAGSFVVGWLALLVLQASQIMLFLRKQGAIDATWNAPPQPYEVFDVVRSATEMFPAPIPLIAVCFFVLAHVAGGRVSLVVPETERSDMAFLGGAAILWICLPPVFFVCATVGLPNLTLTRYFAPSLIAPVLLSGFMLHMIRLSITEASAEHVRRARQAEWLGVCISLLLLAYPVLVAVKDVVRAPHLLSRRAIEIDYAEIAHSSVPCVTNNVHVFFQYTYYRDKHQELALLRKEEAQVERWRKLDGRLKFLTGASLARLEKFMFIYQSGTVNSYPDFDIEDWARRNGYTVSPRGANAETRVYLVRRMGTN